MGAELLTRLSHHETQSGVSVVGFSVGAGPWPLSGIAVCVEGNWRAFENRCPHAKHPLDFPAGRFLIAHKHYLQCGSHGALFDPQSGQCVAGPCQGQALSVIHVTVKDDALYLMGS